MGGFDGPLQAVEQRRVRRKQATEAPIKNGREEEQVAQCLKPRHLAPSRPSGALMAGLTATDASDSDASYSADVDGDDEEDSSVASLPAEFATGPSLHEPHYYRPRSGHQQGAPKPTRLLGDVKAEQGGAAGTSGASTSPSQPMFPPHVLAPNLPESARAPRRHTALQHQVLLPSLAHSLHPSLASAAPTTTTSSGTIDMLPALAAANAPFTRMGTIPHSHIPSNSNYASDTAALTDARYRSPRHGGAGYGTEDDVCYHSATESGFVVAAEQRMGQFSIAIQSATSLPPLAISSFARDFQTAHIESAPMPSENMLPLEQLQTSMDMSEPMQSDNGPVEEVGVTEENFSLPPPKASPESKHGREHAPVMRATAGLVQTYQRVQRNIKERHDLEEAGARSKAAKAPYYFPKIDEVLGGGRYKVVAYLGRGSFGAVVKAEVLDPLFGSSGSSSMSSVASDGEVEDSEGSARNASEAGSSNRMETDSKTPQMVAIKIGRKGTSFLQQGKREVSILERIHGFQATQPTSDLDLFVRALDTFLHEGHMCIVFELLADSLFDLVKYSWEVRPDRPGLSLRMVRKMTHQILCALVTLRNMKIIHSDLKPENIALAQPNRPRLKLLDFGSSCFVADSLLNQFPYIQSRYYRAPEVLLGTGYSCSIDMWSLGCIIAELYLGRPLFVGSSSITQLYCVIEVLGMPMDHVLRNAVHLSRYFHRVGVDANGHAILDPVIKSHRFNHTTIKDIIASKKEQNNPLHMQYFTDLIARMLDWDPVQRINPLEAINHNFILYGPKTSPDGAT
jgi:serine/threonine protein kinase